ncbi:MAG TPA: IS3 family transposase [Puia sp.]|nr:IS3 family transposase [Puia sp.]
MLKGLHINYPNMAWGIDITYIPMAKGFMYLAAIMDLFSRFVVNRSLSNTMEASWITRMVREALNIHDAPEIINSDQGSQFTSNEYITLLKDKNIRISMDGKGRAIDNIFVERLWRSLKYEHVYLNPADDGNDLYRGLEEWFHFYNFQRHHQSLGYKKPAEIYRRAA